VLRSIVRRGADGLARRRGEILPPRRLLARTSSPSPWEFASAGRVIVTCCRLGGLRPEDRILDIGSGVGRAAIPLTGYLSPAAAYTGIDMWNDGVEWCTKAITPRFPNFTFRHVDLRHAEFNPTGRLSVTTARLPFDDSVFDVVMLVAINHLSAEELQALVREGGRVLRPGGTYVGTWFVVDEETKGTLPPDQAGVACDDQAMRATLASASLRLRAFHPGSWRGGEEAVSMQDLVIAEKAGA